jgi:hypothetical protein
MRHRLSILALLLAWAAVSPACATVFRPADLVNLPGAPFEISAAQASAPAPPANGLFGFEFRALNTSPVPLTRIGVEAVVFSPTGEPKGFYQFQIKTNLKPGIWAYLGYGTSKSGPGKIKINAEAGDRIVLMPYAATGPGSSWQAAISDLSEVHAALKAAQGDASFVNLRGALLPQNPAPPGDPGNSGTCLACQNAYSQCEGICKCGVSSVSCNCSDNSQACSCFQCPVPPK